MKEYSSLEFWKLVSGLVELKVGLGPLSQWKKSMINNFIYGLLDELESICKNDIQKARLCGMPIIKNKVVSVDLSFSYYSFRRIFLTKDSNGSKTTKNMFAIYLGFNNYTDLWVNEMTKSKIEFDASKFHDPSQLFDKFVTHKLATYFEYSINAMLGLSKPPSKSLLEKLTEKQEIKVDLLTILEGLYFFNQKEWYLASDSFNKSQHLFLDYYQFYFLTGVAFYQIKYGTYGAKQAQLYLNKALNLLPDYTDDRIKSSLYVFNGAVLLHNKIYDLSLCNLNKGLDLVRTKNDESKAYYYLSCLYASKGDLSKTIVSTNFLRENSGKFYALAMNYIKRNSNDIYENIKYKGEYRLANFWEE